MASSKIGAVVQGLNSPLPSVGRLNEYSAAHMLERMAGRHVEKIVQLTGSGASTQDLFSVNGICRIVDIWFHVTALGDSTTFSGVKFELDDGTAQYDMTDAVDGSGCLEGAAFLKVNTSGNPLLFLDNTTGVVADAVLSEMLADCVVVGKSGADTVIRLVYTGDASTDITIEAECHYVTLIDGGYIAVV